MTRRTYQQAQAWRAAAVALLAEVGVEVTSSDLTKAQRDRGSIVAGRATLVTYLTGSISIGGPAADADYLCEPLERHGLLNGWHPGSRGSGVVWVPQPEPAVHSLLRPGGVDELVAEGLARFEERLRPRPLEVRWAQPGEGIGNLGLGVIVSGWEGRSAQELMDALLALPPRSVGQVDPKDRFARGDRVVGRTGYEGSVWHDTGGPFVAVHFDGDHGPTSYPRGLLRRLTAESRSGRVET